MEVKLIDSVTGENYELRVVNGKLTLSATQKKADIMKIILDDYLLRVINDKLVIREATDEEIVSDILDRKLIDYLPIFIQNYAEIEAIMDAEQPTVIKSWAAAMNVMKDQFVLDATENGVKRWESILEIIPKANYSLDERKFDILARLNEQLPYTIETLKNVLALMCGEDGYMLRLDHNNYTLIVKLSLSNENNVETIKNLLHRVVPANIVTEVSVFNTHGILTAYTHEYLSAYTQKQVREENL